MTGVRDDGLWVTNEASCSQGGQTNQGAAAAGAAAGLVEGVRKLFGDKTPNQKHADYVRNTEKIYAREEKRGNELREERRYQEKLAKNARLKNFQNNAKCVTQSDFSQRAQDRGRRGLTLSQRVFNDAMHDFFAISHTDYKSHLRNKKMRDMRNHICPRLSDFRWRGRDGGLSDQGNIDPAALNLGFGGDYIFNEVWDESLPYYKRGPLATFHRRIAEAYAISADEAAFAVVSEYANPRCAEGLSQFRAAATIARCDRSRVSYADDFYVQEFTVLNMMHQELEMLRKDGPPRDADCFSPDAVLLEVAKDIAQKQKDRLHRIMLAAYRDTYDVVASRAQGIIRDAMVKTERGLDDFNFAHEQYLKISAACDREDYSRIAACSVSISEDRHEVAEEAAVEAAARGIFRQADPKSMAILAIGTGHRIVRAARKSPACRDALEAYQTRACMSRVLPRGVVRMSTDITNISGPVYVAPETKEGDNYERNE